MAPCSAKGGNPVDPSLIVYDVESKAIKMAFQELLFCDGAPVPRAVGGRERALS